MNCKSSNPEVTVLMSCYNSERWLEEAIDSVLSQTWRNFEFVIVNDGSNDNTSEILKGYAKRDDRILIINKKNTGLADSLNVGISYAKGKWIARIDSDDTAATNRIEKQMASVNIYPDTVLVGAGCVVIDASGNKVKKYNYPSGNKNFIKHLIKGGSPFPHSTAFYKTETVKIIGGYRTRIQRAEDKDLWLRLSHFGRILCIQEPLVKLRKHSESITANDARCGITSYAALISSFVVNKGHSDPVSLSNDEYLNFLRWIEKELAYNDYFELYRIRNEIHEVVQNYKQKSFISNIENVIKGTLFLPYLIKIIKHKYLGTNMVEKLSNDWIAKKKRHSPKISN